MIKQFHTPEGIITRELTQEELKEFAELGDYECRLELAKQEYSSGSGVPEKIKIMASLLGLE